MFGGLVGKLKGDLLADSAAGSSPLDIALRNVTHTNSAAVPRGAIEEAVRLASEDEESLALALVHVENNVNAAAKDWRRINGALALLESMLRPGLNGECLVGCMWYEAKMAERLKTLSNFHYEEDTRVQGLIQRTATAAMRAAELHVSTQGASLDAPPETERACASNSEKACTGGNDEGENTPTSEQAGTGGSGTAKLGRRPSPTPPEVRRLNSAPSQPWKASDEALVTALPSSASASHLSSDEVARSSVLSRKSADEGSLAAIIGRSSADGVDDSADSGYAVERQWSMGDGAGGADDVEAAMAATRIKYGIRTAPAPKSETPAAATSIKAFGNVPAAGASPPSRSPALVARNMCCCCWRGRRKTPIESTTTTELESSDAEHDGLLSF